MNLRLADEKQPKNIKWVAKERPGEARLHALRGGDRRQLGPESVGIHMEKPHRFTSQPVLEGFQPSKQTEVSRFTCSPVSFRSTRVPLAAAQCRSHRAFFGLASPSARSRPFCAFPPSRMS